MAGTSGGSVLADIKIIQRMEGIDLNRAQKWAMALKSLYRLSFNGRHVILQGFTVTGVCDFYATFQAFLLGLKTSQKGTITPWLYVKYCSTNMMA